MNNISYTKIDADIPARLCAKDALMEERSLLHTLMDNLPDLIYFKDRESRFTRINLALARKLDLDHPSLAIGKTDFDFLPPEHAEAFLKDDAELLRTGQSIVDKVEKGIWPDGHVTWLSTTKMPLRDSNGNIIGTFGVSRDITDRKRAEEALRNSEDQFRQLADNIHEVFFIGEPDPPRLTYLSPAYEAVWGRPRQEAYERADAWIDTIHPDDRACAINMFSRSFQGEQTSAEYRITRPDWSARYIKARAFPVRDAGGKFCRVVGIAEDLTDAVRAEQQSRLQTAALESAANGIVIASREGRIIWVNPAFTRLTGYLASEVIGENPRFLRSGLHDAVFYQKLWNTILSREVWHGEIVNRRKDGTLYTEEMTITPVCDAQGTLSHFIAIKQDITVRKRAEQDLFFKTALLEAESETTIDGILVVGVTGQVLLANRQFARMWNIPEEAISTKDDKKLMEHALGQIKDSDAFLEKVNYLYTHESEKSRDEIELKDGRVFDRYSSPLQDSTGKLYGRIWYFRDMSERREVERTKSEIVSVVSHELRTPLTSIRGALGLLAAGLLRSQPEKGERMLQIAVANTDRLVRLINDILDLERLESGKMNLEKRTCTASGLMTQAADSVRDLAEKAGVTLSVSLLSARLWVDPDRIIQALINLLSNAIKFSPRGQAVWLTAIRQADQILFQVKDQGRGIPQEKREKIFERFQQVDASDRREKGGTGLGLPITRSIVQQHGGRIWVESTLGQGSAFSFTLPSLPSETAMVDDGSRARKVLLCAAETEIFGAVQAVLSQQGYTLLASASWQEAIEMASIESPDAVLVDSSMPDMDSEQAIPALKQQSHAQELPVIGLGGAAPDEIQLAARGLAGWVTKPFTQASLLPVLDSVLSKLSEGPRVLVVEDDADLARVLTTVFERHGAVVLHARTGQEAVDLCPSFIPDLLVLDVILPELDGFGVVEQLRQHERLQHLPLAVYSVKELDDSEKARLRLGESIFMTKSRLTPQEFEQRAIGLLNWATSGQRERRRR
jgi:PAS domain S-box-containing protein